MENKKTPEIRFAEFTGDWEQRELKDLTVITMGHSPKGENYTENPDDNILVQGNADIKNGWVVPRVWTTQVTKTADIGDIILSVRAPVGDVGKTKYNVVLGRGVAGIKGNEFIFQLLNKMKLNGFWTKYSTGSTFESINSTDLKEAIILAPSELEQNKIGAFLRKLDDRITIHQQEIDTLKQTKRGFLQKLFPKDGESLPEIRFPGVAGDWKQRKLGDILKSHKFKLYLANPNEEGDFEVVQQGDKPVVGYANGSPFENYKDIILFGDHTVSLYKPRKPFFVATDGVKILSADQFNGQYLFTLLERYKPEPQGYRRHFTILKNQSCWITENKEEQEKIGNFFKQLDDTIALHEQEIETLKQTKKAFLQKMFV